MLLTVIDAGQPMNCTFLMALSLQAVAVTQGLPKTLAPVGQTCHSCVHLIASLLHSSAHTPSLWSRSSVLHV